MTWNGAPEAYDDKAAEVGVLREPNEDLRSLKELIVYGLKGMAAYTGHAMRLGYDNPALHEFIQRTLSDIAIGNLSVGELTARVLQTGTFGVQAMALLDQANTGSYGNPEITEVNLGVRSNPGILISGHDLKDMEELLRQTEGTGIDVYTTVKCYLPTTIRHSKNTNISPVIMEMPGGNNGRNSKLLTDRSFSRPIVSYPHYRQPPTQPGCTRPIQPDIPDVNTS